VADRLLPLSFSLPYFGSYVNLLPIALGIVTFVSMAYTNNGWDRSGLTKGLAMGGLFFVLFYSFPAALVLYWLAANLLQFVQQLVIGQK
jgi:membrane protein insertase Oxa1/YidC/SpoIIIJ